MTVTKEDVLPKDVKETINYLGTVYKGSQRITDLPGILRKVTGLEISDLTSWSSQFVSYLIDLQRNFMEGGELDLTVFHQDVINVFHLTKIEKQLLVKNNIEGKLWAIIWSVSFPSQTKFNLND